MMKPVATALLALLCLLLAKANFDIFVGPTSYEEVELPAGTKRPAKSPASQPLRLNPTLPAQLPDLGAGYLFNAERSIARSTPANRAGKGYGQNVRIEDVVFNGAIISAGYKKAIVSYPLAVQTAIRRPANAKPSIASSQQETVQLEEGDKLGGYTVKEISAEHILFTKGSDTIKKMLFDPDKERQQAAPRPTSPPPAVRTNPPTVPARRVVPTAPKRPLPVKTP